ncbi:MAG: hypothetical protein IPK83_13695 [Planctomycetes bacterium]|nr:hypothetical protein [Planctomycetota bacterium]
MGIDLVAIMDHQYTPETISALLPGLRRLRTKFQPFLKMLRNDMHWRIPDDAEWHWEINEKFLSVTEQFRAADDMSELEISFHDGGRIRVYPKTIVYYGTKSWSLFCCNESYFFSVRLRESLIAVALALNSKSIIYAPDSAFSTSSAWDYAMEGDTAAFIEMKLRNECGPPTTVPWEKCLCTADSKYCEGGNSWFMEIDVAKPRLAQLRQE